MKALFPAVLAALVLVPAAAMASDDLAKKSGCLACHAVDKKLVGPAYQDVSKKYAGNKDAESAIINQIKKGGVGKWGQIPMPPQPQVNDADAKALAQWIIGGAK